jgi:glycosyltransferase involved in cell wall biosynthesis
VINQLLERLKDEYRFTRIRRGLFQCPNPRCLTMLNHPVDKELVRDYDIIMPQNVDTLAMLPDGSPIVCRIGGIDVTNLQRDRYAKDFARVAGIVATNDELADIARDANPNVTVIPNGVDLDHFRPADERPDRPFTIGFAGNVWGPGADYKGWRFFVEASVKLQIMSSVESKYLLHGSNQIPHEEMPGGFYHQIDALILPSKGEGCSNVVTEALACGVVPIITKVGYHGERLEDGVNCLFIERSVSSIEAAVMKLVENPEMTHRIGGAARAFAVQYHDIDAVAKAYDEVFRAVLRKD